MFGIRRVILLLLIFGVIPACSSLGSRQLEAEKLYTMAMEVAREEQTGDSDNLQVARNLLAKSAALDYMPAIHALGWMKLQGIGIEKDRHQAFQHFHRAALAGYAESQYMLGVLYAQGWGTDPSDSDSLFWIQEAAKQGHEEAQRMMRNLFASPVAGIN